MTGAKLQSILDEMHEILSHAVGPNNRREYMRANGIRGGVNWSFSLTAADIIRDRIPARVIGCSGIAKLFCHLAASYGLECRVVAMARLADWTREDRALHGVTPDNDKVIINGHQIIAVDTGEGLRMFDPARRSLQFLGDAPRVGGLIEMFGTDYIIRALVPGADFMKVLSYWDLDAIYRGQ